MPTGPTGPASTASAAPTRGGSGATSRPSSRELIARQASRTGNHAGPLHEAGRVSKAAACWACDACAGCPPRLPTFGSRTMTSRTGRNPRVRTTRTTHRTERPWIHPPKDLHHARRSDRPLQTIMHDPANGLCRSPGSRDAVAIVGGGGGGSTVVEALCLGAVASDEPLGLVPGFHPFGDDVETEGASEDDEGFDDPFRARAEPDPPGETTVDLQFGDRKVVKVGQRRVPGPEVVDREPDADVVQAAKSRQRRAAGADEGTLDQFEMQPVGAQVVPGKYSLNVFDQLGVVQLTHRQVDADEGVGMSGRERRGPVEHPVTDRDDEAGLFGDVEKLVRCPRRVGSARPAQQRFVPADAAGVQIDDRLVVQRERVGGHGRVSGYEALLRWPRGADTP